MKHEVEDATPGRGKNTKVVGLPAFGVVIGHGIGGKVIPAKMAQLAES